MNTAILFENARIINPVTGTDTLGSIRVENGKITAEGPTSHVIDCAGKCLAPGIIDVGVKVCEPGERHKESFRSVGAAAAAGGVTTILTRPDTTPAIDSPETVEFLARRAQKDCIVNTYPIASLTKGRAGQEMSEIGFLMDAGVVAFSDCENVVTNSKVLSRALTYAHHMGAVVIGHPQDPGLSKGASCTSGKFASLRGLPTVSAMAEGMGLDRDLAFAEMTGVAYHADQITTERALERLARAKKAGLDVTAGISIHHLTLNEFDVADYRTFFKFTPPLRTEDDRIAACQAVASGLIDIISSMHTPQDEESKRLPFEEAASGAVGLEALLPAALSLVHNDFMDLPTLWRALSTNPAKRFNLPGGTLEEGAPADLVLFDPDAPFIVNRADLRSKCKNTPFDGQRMQGKVLQTFISGRTVYDDRP